MADDNVTKAREVFERYGDVDVRSHRDFAVHAQMLERFYRGGGGHWKPEDRAYLEAMGRPVREINTILPTVSAAVGYQIANRMDVSFLPKTSPANDKVAKVLAKVMKHALDNTDYQWAETDAFRDGLVQQRGFLELRMDYGDSTNGDLSVQSLDPLDVLPDPDGRTYDPDGWSDVMITRWMTESDIEGMYGSAAAKEVKAKSLVYVDEDFHKRDAFGPPESYAAGRGWYDGNDKLRRYRVIDRQSHEYRMTLVAMFPNGEFRSVEGLPEEKLAWYIDQGIPLIKRRIKRVWWRVAAPEVCVIDEVSPYDHFTVIPFFPYFNRGKTMGMVDNMVSPAQMLDKFMSQYEHVVNTSANSGWQGEANILENMTDEEFTGRGAETGLVLLRRAGSDAFQKIQPNQIPTGIDNMIQMATGFLDTVSGVDKALREPEMNDLSGKAIQAMQYASQQKLACVLDNLARTRRMVAERALEIIQRYMGHEKIIQITDTDLYGVQRQKEVPLNVRQPDGSIFNDLTIGEYSVVVTDKPMQVTFDSSEFEQLKDMREMGIAIPDAVVIRASTLADKSEIADAMQELEGKPDPDAEQQLALLVAQTRKAENEAVAKSIEAQYSALQTAQAIVVTPQAAAIADALLRSGGFVDQDEPPIVPQMEGEGLPVEDPFPPDTTPLTPVGPSVGMGVGMKEGLTDGPTQPPPTIQGE